jgi:nicotinamide phosphoribosyltransferase
VEIEAKPRDIEKDPVTDPDKKSHKGLLSLRFDDESNYVTEDERTAFQEEDSLLVPVFRDGKLLKEYTLNELRTRVNTSASHLHMLSPMPTKQVRIDYPYEHGAV